MFAIIYLLAAFIRNLGSILLANRLCTQFGIVAIGAFLFTGT